MRKIWRDFTLALLLGDFYLGLREKGDTMYNVYAIYYDGHNVGFNFWRICFTVVY